NDAYGGTSSTDRNLYLNSATLDGQLVSSSQANLWSAGTAHISVTAASAGPATTSTTADALTLFMSEDAFQGDAQFTVQVDGATIGGVQTVTALHGSGQSQAFTVAATLGMGSHQVGVTFLNDAYAGDAAHDRNLYVDRMTLFGKIAANSTFARQSNGSVSTLLTTDSTGHLATAAATPVAAPVPSPTPTPSPTRPTSIPASPATVTHGSQVNASNTGPGAIGINNLTIQNIGPSFTINDQTSASFIQRVAGSATYDGVVVNGPHLLIQSSELHGSIEDYSSMPLVVLGSKIVDSYNTSAAIHARSSAGPLYLLNSDVSATSGANVDELVWLDSSNSVALGNHIHGISSDGMQVGGGAQNVRIVGNLIDQWTPAAGAHTDGIQMDGTARNVTFSDNKVLLNNGETGAINMVGWFGKTSSVTMDSNYLAGGSATFYGPDAAGASGNSFTNNIFGKDFYSTSGQYFPVYKNSWASGDTWANNTFSDGHSVSSNGVI
ncbi:MAG: hypothetical protein M3N26_07495, partial [Pseudomonadota bacterium]|nr:hypothetical protein [Pseudomonadota bacterium]